jgi:hypothetical protein
VTLRDAVFRTDKPDARPTVALFNVAGAIIDGVASAAARGEAVRAQDSRDVALGTLSTIDR